MKKWIGLIAAVLLLAACSPDISDVEDPTPATDPADLFPGARTDAPPAEDTEDTTE